MADKSKKSKAGLVKPAANMKPEEKITVARKALLEMKKKLLAEGLGKSLPEDLARPFDIGDEGDRADIERTHEVSICFRCGIRKSCWQSKRPWKSSARAPTGCAKSAGTKSGRGD